MSYETILTKLQDNVLTITINRPDKKNAFNIQQYNEIAAALKAAMEDVETLAVVLTGSGGAFSAGQDLSGGGGAQPPGQAPGGFAGYVDTLLEFDKPLLAAVNGVAVGVGVTTLFHCDVVYAAESSRFRMPFTALGIVPEACSSVLLPLIVGPQKAAEILLTADWISSSQALDLGMCARVIEDDALLSDTLETARKIAAQAPSAVRETKKLLMAGRAEALKAAHQRELETLGRCFGSPENMEALMAFMQKRQPDFAKLRQS